jgi:heptosyltransferase-3
MGWRDWTDEKWVKLFDLIIEKYGIKLVEIGRINSLEFQHPNFKCLVGQTSLKDMMKIIRSADFFIGLDSGPTHMANAFQIPGLVLCGEFSFFKTYMPYSGFYQDQIKTKILFNEIGPANGLPLELVWQELQLLN